jgi:hypothetical protein
MSNIKVNVNSQNLTSIRVGQQNATKVVSSVGGLQGIQGLQGRQGLQGIAGQFAGQGAQGPLGGLGDQGTQGLQGLQGNIGYQGTQGLQGTQGRQGLQGNIGIQGFVGQPGGNAGRIFYFNRTDLSDIPGFYRATETPSPHDLSSTVVGLSTTDDIVIDQFVTDLNSPGVSDLPVGDAEITLHVQLSEGSATVTLNVSLCESDGSGIFPISSSTSDIFTNTTSQELKWDYVRTIPYSLGVTRRLIYNFHVNKITGSDSTTLTVYYEDNKASLIKSTISAGAVGPQGIQGTRGNQGLQGNRGQQGAQGLLGRQGTQGLSGEFAGQGTQGLQGLIGPIAGSNTQVLFNDNNVSAGATNFVYDATNQRVGINTTLPTSTLTVVGDSLITGITTVGLGTTSTPPSNSQMSFELTSNTNLVIKVRGTDGVLRSGNVTLS